MNEKIIFLDIDGPVIPYGSYFVNRRASHNRTFSNTCIGYVKKLLELSDAKLVTNSMHNFYDRLDGRDDENDPKFENLSYKTLQDDLVNAGILRDSFHENWRTPLSAGYGVENPRLEAIYAWIKANNFYGNDRIWIDFDDEDFAPNLDYCINVSFEDGITFNHFVKACKIFDVRVPLIFG